MLNVIQTRKVWYTLSGISCGLAVILYFVMGLNFGIDFTGGSILELEFKQNRPSLEEFKQKVGTLDLERLSINALGDNGFLLRFEPVKEEKRQDVLKKLGQAYPAVLSEEENKKIKESGLKIDVKDPKTGVVVNTLQKDTVNFIDSSKTLFEVSRFESTGPVMGEEMKSKAVYAIGVSILGIIVYVAWAFRQVSKPIRSWQYGLVTVMTLFHDILIPIGVFVLIGNWYHVEVNMPFVAALLTILGYSVNDTIVVFDRIRENLLKQRGNFDDLINASVNQSLARSINTSLTTILALIPLFFFGGSTLSSFILALIIGVAVGTYSSIFIAAPMLYTLAAWQVRGKQ